jgi:hypothetical protein
MPLPNLVCANGNWSVVSMLVMDRVAINSKIQILVTGNYTQLENGTLNIVPGVMFLVGDTAILAGEIVLNGTVNESMPIISASTIEGKVSHSRTITGDCLDYIIEKKDGLEILILNNNCKKGMPVWLIIVITLSSVGGVLLIGLGGLLVYRCRPHCILFHDQKSYENIRDEWPRETVAINSKKMKSPITGERIHI